MSEKPQTSNEEPLPCQKGKGMICQDLLQKERDKEHRKHEPFNFVKMWFPLCLTLGLSLISYYVLSEIDKKILPLDRDVKQHKNDLTSLEPRLTSYVEKEIIKISNRTDTLSVSVKELSVQVKMMLDNEQQRTVERATSDALLKASIDDMRNKLTELNSTNNKFIAKTELLQDNVREQSFTVKNLVNDVEALKNKEIRAYKEPKQDSH